jgi:hypothetical protein
MITHVTPESATEPPPLACLDYLGERSAEQISIEDVFELKRPEQIVAA